MTKKPTAKIERWQFSFNEESSNLKVGVPFFAARQDGRGPWWGIEDLPAHVREFFLREPDNWFLPFPKLNSYQDFKLQTERGNDRIIWHESSAGLCGTVEIHAPNDVISIRQRIIPGGICAIRNLSQLCEHFRVDTPCELKQQIQDDTNGKVSISVETSQGKWYHPNENWRNITEITAFMLQTADAKSRAKLDSEFFQLPILWTLV